MGLRTEATTNRLREPAYSTLPCEIGFIAYKSLAKNVRELKDDQRAQNRNPLDDAMPPCYPITPTDGATAPCSRLPIPALSSRLFAVKPPGRNNEQTDATAQANAKAKLYFSSHPFELPRRFWKEYANDSVIAAFRFEKGVH